LKTRIGRNDPCHCGSGKKYKRCCLALDERCRAASPAVSAAAETSFDEAVPPPSIQQIPDLLQKLASRGPKEERAEFARLQSQIQPILSYMQRQPEIETASKALEEHRQEFDALAEDEEAYLERARVLFAEERFAPLRFTADDVRRAFDKVGQPQTILGHDQAGKILRTAILHLADEDRRNHLSMSLLLHLPDDVRAERWLDAWVLQHCSYYTSDFPNESNPFLFEMFSYGYNAWVEKQRGLDGALLAEVGMDLERLQSMNIEELEAWLQEQQADPARKARMEALLLANPQQRAQASASLEAMERNSVTLLEREDASALLLSPQDIERWLPILNECCESFAERLPEESADLPRDEATTRLFGETVWPVLGEMAGDIFTPDRIRQLIAQLKTYRNERFAAGEKGIAGLTLGAITSLEREDDPSKNYFLLALCFNSLRKMSGPGTEAGI